VFSGGFGLGGGETKGIWDIGDCGWFSTVREGLGVVSMLEGIKAVSIEDGFLAWGRRSISIERGMNTENEIGVPGSSRNKSTPSPLAVGITRACID